VTDDVGRATLQAPSARLWWLMLARGVVALLLGPSVLLAAKSRPALGNFTG
jgi:uncharacterized membrane protein HdeD (DUF308 family)